MNTTKRNVRMVQTGLVSSRGERLYLEVSPWVKGRLLVSAVVIQADGYKARPRQFEVDGGTPDSELSRLMLEDWSADNYGPHAENGWTMETA